MRSSGLLLTNLHVVEGTELVGVRVPKTTSVLWASEALGFDPDNDLVVLEVETKNVRPVLLGDSDSVKVGDPIIVISNPQGLEQTISNGLVSAVREVSGRKLFQISAPISSGSSGGPVFNERGEVVGIVVGSLESGQNLNFAIPVNYAKPLLERPQATPIAALPKRKNATDASGHKEINDPAKMAVQAISQIADAIRACPEESDTNAPTGKRPEYRRVHWGPPTDVRFDVEPSDSLVARYVGTIEFSTRYGMSQPARSREEAANAPDWPLLSGITRHRHVFRITDTGVELDHRSRWDGQSQQWVLEEGSPTLCSERIGYR